ncbi:MAG: hypothetical protein DSM107014_09800 [Gomphosphaeria aponina SAG 52.96 = DSM 107014]|uniref:Uncharacterized protein n=1 Tax=Gomphosphaeria aponina SAG 52.96 = DSM 107014 TaxID=1521640 RepID=A0A941GQT8_9CHRO|nr:hypothetical protein [Gomphosphaeria aponina SAG 52.96 = DSM 107014]
MVFKVPKFENGQILSEQELYALARVSIESFRWNCIAGKNFGFFAPSEIDCNSSSNSWNQFDWENDNLFVSNVLVISSQGYPFIIQGRNKIEQAEKRKILFAVAYLAKDSQSYKNNGYKIDFKWDLPEIESNKETEPFLIELGRVTGNENNRKFELTPPILQLNGTSKLWEIVLILKKYVDKYIEQLIIAVGENNIDAGEYIDRLERLNLFAENTQVDKFIDTAILTLKSATGFYHRLIYHQSKSQIEACKNLMGRALERQLARINGNKIEPEIFDSIDELLEMEVKTGQEQQTFIEKLSYLLASTSHLFKKLQTNKKELLISKGYPKRFDIMRDLYRYQLPEKEGKKVVVEFNVEPTNVAFIFTREENIKSTETLIPLKEQAQNENPQINRRYKLLLDPNNYLFIAAPEQIIKKVELINA